MNILNLFSTIILVALLAGCNTMKVTSEPDSSYDFSTIKTYQWIAGPSEILEGSDTYINKDIQLALSQEFEKKDLQSVSSATLADVQIAYYVKLKEEMEYTKTNPYERDFSGGFVYSREQGSWSYGEREPDLNIYTVEIGTLTVLVYDTQTGIRIWRGNLKTKIDRSRPPEQQQERIQQAAEKLLTNFLKMDK